MRQNGNSRTALALFVAALCSAAAILLAGPGTQWGLWSFGAGFAIMRWAAWIGLGVAGLSLIACFAIASDAAARGLGLAAAGLACGVLAFAVPASLREAARRAPRISDITTDTRNPPQFVRIVALRDAAKGRNPAAYGGETLASLQRRAYPDIAPLTVALAPRAVFDEALALVADLGWNIVSSAPGEGRIEATATTPWFGFKDDVVIRVAADGGGTRVDVRSVSRVGRNDAGANAARIRVFLRRLAERLGRN
jgi:uncharacterized protein (DUF1499 family)